MHPLIKSIIQKMKKKINNAILSFLVLYVVVLQVFLGQGIETFFFPLYRRAETNLL
jgi:hypothetical protein